MGAYIPISALDLPAGHTPLAGPDQFWIQFIDHIDSENFDEAGRMIHERSVNTDFHSDFYDSKIKELLLPLTNPMRFQLVPLIDRAANLQKVLRITEFFNSRNIESSYCRICRAVVYLELDETVKLEALVPVLCQPRGYRQASDLLQLNHLIGGFDDREMREQFFAPLYKFINNYLERKTPTFPINSLGAKA